VHRYFHSRAPCLSIADRPRAAALTKRTFGPVEWLPARAIGEDVLSLLPEGILTLTKAEIIELHVWFGARGKFPAMRGGTGRTEP
jgi:hypothetical protein